MAKHSCLNVTMDDQKVSSPMPFIGVYIAAASLVCFLFMLCDVVHGLHRRKTWLPCRFFSLNSLTLTLLAITTKLPVDLTTSMPSALDQLSKLSATILLCISMSFFLPSLGTRGDSEWVKNMASLSILVVTVIVNVCIQIATGVIFSFVKEHVIIMFCMLLILIILSTSNLGYGLIFSNIEDIVEPLKKSVPESSTIMMDRLKSVYECSYSNNPKLYLSCSPSSITVGMISTVSALVLLEATVRSFVFKEVKFHCGISDYKWSMWMVVVVQILTVLLGGIAIAYRWFTSASHFRRDIFPIIICSTDKDTREKYVKFSISKKLHVLSLFQFSRLGFVNIFLNKVKKIVIVLQTMVEFMTQLATIFSLKMRIYLACKENGEEREELDKEWINEKSVKDINGQIEKYKMDSSTHHLIQILPNNCDHQELPISLPKEKVSSLLVVILIRMTKVLLPDSLSVSLFNALDEAFEIICFVYDKRIDLDTCDIKVMNSLMAKDVWMNKDNPNHWFNKKFIKRLVKRSIGGGSESQLDLSCGLEIIKKLSCLSDEFEPVAKEFCEELNFVQDELSIICNLIIDWNCASINGLYDQFKQLFAGMLNILLSQLPVTIFSHAVESSYIEQCEERARLGIKFICKVKPLVGKVNWSFPDRTRITSLINDDDVLSSSATNTRHIQEHV